MADPSSNEVKESRNSKKVATTPNMDTDTGTGSLTRSSKTEQTSPDSKISSLEDGASFLSRILLTYLDPILKLGGSKVLTLEDVGVPSAQDKSNLSHETLKRRWEEEVLRTVTKNETRKKTYDKKFAATPESKRSSVKPYVPLNPSLKRAIFLGSGRMKVLVALFLYTLSALMKFLPVIFLNDLVKYFEIGESYTPLLPPWVSVFGLGVIPLVVSVLENYYQVTLLHTSVFCRTSVSTLLFEKSLKVSATGRARTSTGQVVNMMSNDTNQLQRFLQLLGFMLLAPVQIIVALALIYQQVGNATWVGVCFMVVLAPINGMVFSKVGKYRRTVLKYSDLRVKLTNEILSGIRIIKFYAWERPFGKELGELREKELQALTLLAYVTAIGFSLILLSAPIIQPILVFLTYVKIQDEPLSASKAFTTVALFNIMRFPFAFLPLGLLQYIQSMIAIRRLETYFSLPDLTPYVQNHTITKTSGNCIQPACHDFGSVSINKASFGWIDPNYVPATAPSKEKNKKKSGNNSPKNQDKNKDENKKTSDDIGENPIILKNISLNIPSGSLVAVVGPVGSGKSSLLSAILGEMEYSPDTQSDSHVYIPSNNQIDNKQKNGDDGENTKSNSNFISYCSQTPWVVNDTLRGNILFGRPYEESRYNTILEACALTDDLAILPASDLTEIGERGINLSGGQKARVSLARALYSQHSKILLLDDPLSAVDAHVGEHLFEDAILNVGDNCTRILVTHHVHFLHRCDLVVVLEEGRIKDVGSYEELVERGMEFKGAVEMEAEDTDNDNEKNTESEKDNMTSSDIKKKDKDKMYEKKSSSANLEEQKKGSKLIKDEEREEGQVDGKAYMHYARIGGYVYAALILIIQGLGRACEIMAAFWLSVWAERSITADRSGTPLTSSETTFYINIYALFGMVGVLGLTGRSLCLAVHRLRASRRLHEDLAQSILHAPVAFFDVTPIGRVLNRFAADMDKIDLELSSNLSQGVNTLFSVLGAVGAIVASTKGVFTIPLIPITYIYYYVQKWFRKTSTELQRVVNIAISPIFADFSQILSGPGTVRAFGEEQRFFLKSQQSFDDMNAAYVLVQLTNYWLGLRLDVLGGIISAFIAALAVATSPYKFIPAGWLGLGLSYAIEVTGFLKYGVRIIATVEADMSSVERVLTYSNNIQREAPDFVPAKDPQEGTWPNKGEIVLQNASMRYRDGPLVLKNISFKIQGGEKIGVVGRTGSGKSSLMILLFRIVELATSSEDSSDKGKVIIDGIDTSEIGTEALRLNLSIIPQDPVMFSNTVRYNLDPFGTISEEELWNVLRKVQLEDVIKSLPGQLDEAVAEGGENFSQGQRQLLCIARSLLRKPKILFMDEATASIDNDTDALIQRMIRENFADATVLTIAHRLGTIMDSDRVLVLENGNIAEFDTPSALLADEDGVFKSMVDKSRSSAHGSCVNLGGLDEE